MRFPARLLGVAKEIPQKAALMLATAAGCGVSIGASCSKRLVPRVLVRVLLPVVDLLDECLGFLLIHKGQSSHAMFQLEGVEEDAVLIVLEGVVDFLVPYYSSIGRLQPLSAYSTSYVHV